MVSLNLVRAAAILLGTSWSALAAPARPGRPLITHVGNRGALYSGAVATKDIIFVSGAVPSVNGTIPEGIRAQTITAINNIAAILEEAGTSWENALKTTVFLANMDDYEGMNEMYGEMLPQLKPARTTVQASKLPGKYLIEMDLVAAIPRC